MHNDIIIMMTWLALYVNLVTSHLACAMCTHMHGTCALCRNSMSKYLSGLVCPQAHSKHRENNRFTFLGTKYPKCNENMPKNMLPITCLNKNSMDCNDNLAWSKQEPLVHPYVFWYKTKGEKAVETSFTFISCSNHNFLNSPILIPIEFQYASTTEGCLGSVPHAKDLPSSQFGCPETPCVCKFDCCVCQQFHWTSSLAQTVLQSCQDKETTIKVLVMQEL